MVAQKGRQRLTAPNEALRIAMPRLVRIRNVRVVNTLASATHLRSAC
jgi:hypothetical protein